VISPTNRPLLHRTQHSQNTKLTTHNTHNTQI